MKGVWTCTGGCGRSVKSEKAPKEFCDCCSHPGSRGWLCCTGPNDSGECTPGSCFRCDRDRDFLKPRDPWPDIQRTTFMGR